MSTSTAGSSRRAFLRGDIGRASPVESVHVEVSAQCLLRRGVVCRACTDACESGALRFRLRLASAGAIDLDEERCTACGDCLPVCPTRALTLAAVADA